MPNCTLSEALATLTTPGVGLAAPRWSTVRWADYGPTTRGGYAVRVGGAVHVLPEAVVEAVDAIGAWAGEYEDLAADHPVLARLPGERWWMGSRWIAAVIEGGAVEYGRYHDVRIAYETEVADGASDRTAWTRARAALLGRPGPAPGRRGRPADLSLIPRELRPAYDALAERARVEPSTARTYRSVLRPVFRRTGGRIPTASDLDDILWAVASDAASCAAVGSAWRALCRAAAVDGVALPDVRGRTRRNQLL